MLQSAAMSEDTSSVLREDTKIGSYRIVKKLAEGGMGQVYIAHHELMEREAVVKVLHQKLLHDEDVVRRFLNEAKAAAAIKHPGIVEIYDLGRSEGQVYIVMERLRGETLAERIARAPLVTELVVTLSKQLIGALAAAHAHDIVHRDIKPENLFVVEDPDVVGGKRIKILDFGVAKLAPTRPGGGMTAQGTIFGTPAYMAPEQCEDSTQVDHRSDLYAIGCIMYEMLCSEPPFGLGGMELLAAHLRDIPEPLSKHNPKVPEDVENIVLRLLEKKPDDRYQSCEELLAALDQADTTPRKGATGKRKQSNGLAFAATVSSRITGEGPVASPSDSDSDRSDRDAPTEFASDGVPYDSSGSEVDDLFDVTAKTSMRGKRAVVASPTTHRHATGEVVSDDVEHDARPRGRVTVWMAVAAVALIGAAGLFYKLTSDAGTSEQPVQVVEPKPKPEPTPKPKPKPKPNPGLAFLTQGEQALTAMKWEDAIVAATQATAGEATTEMKKRADAIKEKAREGLKYSWAFGSFNDAVSKGNIRSAVYAYEQLPADSIYRERATPAYTIMRDSWLAPHLTKVNELVERERCRKIDDIATKVRFMFPESVSQIVSLSEQCRLKRDKTLGKPAAAPVEIVEPVEQINEKELANQVPKYLIRKTLRKYRKRLAACSIEHPTEEPVTATIEIAPSGKLKKFELDNGSKELHECIWFEIRQEKFRRARESTRMTFPIGRKRRADKTSASTETKPVTPAAGSPKPDDENAP